jgi:small subunit ribosomal protein S7e
VAQNFKTQGNEYFKGKRYREAIGFYNQGVDTKPTDNAIIEALLLNRAACNVELRERI